MTYVVFLEEGNVGIFLLFLEGFDGVDEEHADGISATHFGPYVNSLWKELTQRIVTSK